MADNACVDAICHRLSWTNGATVRGWQSLTGCSAADVQSALDALVDQGALVVLYELVCPECSHTVQFQRDLVIRPGMCLVCDAEWDATTYDPAWMRRFYFRPDGLPISLAPDTPQ